MTGIFKPFINQLDNKDWGIVDEEQKKEFLQGFEKFNKELGEAITSINDQKKLAPANEDYLKLAAGYNGIRDKS